MHNRTLSKLPARPNLGQYRKQAKDLLKAAASAENQARIRRHHPRWQSPPDPDPPPFKLADAQLVIAREHGFASWPAFVAHITASTAKPAANENVRQLRQFTVDGAELDAEQTLVANASALVLLLHASGSDRYRPEIRTLVSELNRAGFCTLSVDLLTFDEELGNADLAADVPLLAARSGAVIDSITQTPALASLPLGVWAMHIGAAVAITVAAKRPTQVNAVVSSSGRPDLAGSCAWKVLAPTLLLNASGDSVGLGFNTLLRTLFPRTTVSEFKVIPSNDTQFSSPAAREEATALACLWFQHHLTPRKEGHA